jgi:hypothetical protein
MTDSERQEQEKSRSWLIKQDEETLTNRHGKAQNGVESSSVTTNGNASKTLEIPNTMDEQTDPVEEGIKTNGYYKLTIADTDPEEEDEDVGENGGHNLTERSSRFNNTSGGADFHLEMSQSILVSNQSTHSSKFSHVSFFLVTLHMFK